MGTADVAKVTTTSYLYLRSFSCKADGDVRLKVLLVALVISLALWAGWFYATRGLYHAAQDVGVMPNLHIKENIRDAISSD